MRSLHLSRPPVSRGAPWSVGAITALLLAGCSVGADEADSGPPRLTPDPRYDVARSMIENRPAPEGRLNACELLDLTTAQVIALTRADMPETEPTGSGDLGLICTYGGPGSPARAEAEATAEGEDEGEGEGATDSEDDAEASTTATSTAGTSTGISADAAGTDAAGTDAETATPWSTTDTVDPDRIPDTFAAGVVEPRGGAAAALAGQPALLGARYACSEVRGARAATVEGAPPATPGAPAPTLPALDTAYIDCVAAPAGGGVEVHTVLVSDDYLWHITLLRPEIDRTTEAETAALAGLHRVAGRILA